MFGKKQKEAEAAPAPAEPEEPTAPAEVIEVEEQKLVEEESFQEEEEEAKRIAEEAKITQEISDADLAKQKAEAEERRKRPMLKTYTLIAHFKTNSYFLNAEDKAQIKKIGEELKDYDYKKMTIEGHTDSTGTKEINKRLSRQRARSVYDEFIKAGVPAEKMSYQGFAATMPVQSNSTAAGRAANRRTEIFVE
jgi:outer membrane protein OmpA-like peptidoglycan-associated protein